MIERSFPLLKIEKILGKEGGRLYAVLHELLKQTFCSVQLLHTHSPSSFFSSPTCHSIAGSLSLPPPCCIFPTCSSSHVACLAVSPSFHYLLASQLFFTSPRLSSLAGCNFCFHHPSSFLPTSWFFFPAVLPCACCFSPQINFLMLPLFIYLPPVAAHSQESS